MMPFQTGIIYALDKTKKDRIHIETCGPDNYILFVENNVGDRCLLGLSRKDAEDLCRALLIHIETTKKLLGDCE